MKKPKLLWITFIFLLFCHNLTVAQIKIDEYGAIITDDEFARLGSFVEQLKEDGNAQGTIVIYKNRRETTGKFLRHFYGLSDFLVKSFGVSPDRFSVLFGGEENTRRTEVWMSNPKIESVKIENKVLDETLNGKIIKKTLFDENYLAGDESPFINQFIFREGLDYLANALKANPETDALIKIGKVEYLSGNAKERKTMIKQIIGRLKKNQIQKNRFSIEFTSGESALFYITPKIAKIISKK